MLIVQFIWGHTSCTVKVDIPLSSLTCVHRNSVSRSMSLSSYFLLLFFCFSHKEQDGPPLPRTDLLLCTPRLCSFPFHLLSFPHRPPLSLFYPRTSTRVRLLGSLCGLRRFLLLAAFFQRFSFFLLSSFSPIFPLYNHSFLCLKFIKPFFYVKQEINVSLVAILGSVYVCMPHFITSSTQREDDYRAY